MKVIIEQERICIGSDCVRYYPFYFKSWAEDHQRNAGSINSMDVMNTVLQQWADTLAGMGIAYNKLFLPYSLDDESIECFKATAKSPPITHSCNVTLRCVVVEGNGYSLDLSNLYKFMTTQQTVFEVYPSDFGVYDKDELVQGLSDAKIVST